MVDTTSVKWEVFSQEEQEAIKRLMKFNVREYMTGGVLNMTPEKEGELQKIVDAMKPNNLLFKSKILEEDDVAKVKAGLPTGPQTPEEEKILQKKLDDEIAAFQAKEAHKHVAQNVNLKNVTKFCDACDSVGGKHKDNCSTLNKRPVVEILPAASNA